MSETLQVCKEVQDVKEEREVLLANITDLTRDLCGVVLRMEATNHFDLIGRLKADIETYAALLRKATAFIKEYDKQRVVIQVAARKELGRKFCALNRELDSFGARLRTNRLVELVIHQGVNTRTLDKVHNMTLEAKLEKWLRFPPDAGRKQFETQKLRKEGTGRWLLDNVKFIEWQDNPGSLWIRGPSGAGKSVLSSTVITTLVDENDAFNPARTPAVAFFYFDFKDKDGQTMDSTLRRIVLQLSAQSSRPYEALNKLYMKRSKGQILPTQHELLKVLEELLLELGRTYIVLDALDECRNTELEQLLGFISGLQRWTQTPLHLLVTSQPRPIFTTAFAGVACIELDSEVTQQDISVFVDSELRNLEIWANCADYIAQRVVRKSNGMFRLAACLLVALSRCPWEDELDKTLENLPDDLHGIYDRFLQAICPEHLVYAEAVLRWLIFSATPLTLEQLADTVAFDFSDRSEYIYKPNRRQGNIAMIPQWFEGLVVVDGDQILSLAHSSVRDYVLSVQFTAKFGCDLRASLSHTFIAETCICYLLHCSKHSLDDDTLPNYPLAGYTAQFWCHHLLRAHDRTRLFPGAMCLLEERSGYSALRWLHLKFTPWLISASPLHLCCQEGYIEGARGLLATNVDINLQSDEGSPLKIASNYGYIKIVRLLLDSGADVHADREEFGTPLWSAAGEGHKETVRLLLENGADGTRPRVLQAASRGASPRILGAGKEDDGAGQKTSISCRTEIVRLLLNHGADVNATGGEYGSALQAASELGHIEIVHFLLDNGADAKAKGGKYGSALQAASRSGYMEIMRLLLQNGADVNAKGGEYGSALQAASLQGNTDAVLLLLENNAVINMTGGEYGSALQAASRFGHTEIVRLLLEKGADVNANEGKYGSPLQVASNCGRTEIVRLLIQNGADVNKYTCTSPPAHRQAKLMTRWPTMRQV
ncbi:ankyrin repeat-containing domain protein [Mycena latifolia]|nr:ankyrin repeat-containing domain protein [Mycena latifolia]